MNQFLKGFFWFAFAAFLAASIPHVAYFFRAFEPQGDAQDTLWWAVSYAIAVSIDVTIFLLSVTVARLHRRGNTGKLIFSVWLFILALCGLSWFINWEYAQQFSSTLFSRVTPIQLSVLNFTVGKIGDINPIIASAFQVLAIAYTWIADKIAADEKPKTAAELKLEADELEARAKEQDRISGLKRQGRKGTLLGFIDDASDVVKHTKDAFQVDEKLQKASEFLAMHPQATDEELAAYLGIKRPAAARFWRLKVQSMGEVKPSEQEQYNESSEPPITEVNDLVNDEVKQPEPEVQTEVLEAPIIEVKQPDQEPQNDDQLGFAEDVLGVLKVYPHVYSWLSKSRRTATIDEIAEVTGQSKRRLINRVNDGTLKRAPRNAQLILISSVLTWLKVAPLPGQNGGNTGEMPAIKLVERTG